MRLSEQISAEIMASIEAEVKDLFVGATRKGAGFGEVEDKARELALEFGSKLIEGIGRLLRGGYEGAHLRCKCGGLLTAVDYREAWAITTCGKARMRRAYYICDRCSKGMVPLDRYMGLGKGRMTEGAQRIVGRVTAEMSFENAKELIGQLAGIWVSSELLEEVSVELGGDMEDVRQGEIKQIWDGPEWPEDVPKREVVQISIDGTTAPTQEGFKEVKTAVLYEPKTEKGPDGSDRVTAVGQRYVSSFEAVDEFGKGVWSEGARYGAVEAKQVVVISDAAEWINSLTQEHFPGALQILDFWHATDHLAALARAHYGQGSDVGLRWLKGKKDRLKLEGGCRAVCNAVKRLKVRGKEAREAQAAVVQYFEKNCERMKYNEYLRSGYHIGSGLAEGACKHVVKKRLRMPGWKWKKGNAQAILQLRTAIINADYDQRCRTIFDRRRSCA
jgi:hypothetical protein